jgi:hypothetical protein
VDGTGDSPARVLLSDSERDHFVAVLREHYAAGRLSLEELRRRAGIVLAAAYLDEARGAMAELPGTAVLPPVASQQPRQGWLSRRGHAEAAEPAPGWQRTDERFRDPSSGKIMRVWTDPADGSRHYVPDDTPTSG